MGSRVYHAKLRQFLQPDVLDPMTYTYANGDPVNHVDPSGMIAISVEARDRITSSVSGHVFGVQKLGTSPRIMMDTGGAPQQQNGAEIPIDEHIPVTGERRRGGGIDYDDLASHDMNYDRSGPRSDLAGGGGRARDPYTAAEGRAAIAIGTGAFKLAIDGVGIAVPVSAPATKVLSWAVSAIGFLWAVGYVPPSENTIQVTLEGP